MNPLLALLGQQAGVQAVQPVAGNEIQVLGQRNGQPSAGADYEDYSLNNSRAVLGRSADVKETENASDRKGMFGVKGTLRDILGLVGDAFLVQSGNKAVYAPQRQQERISDAGAGFTEDPVAASERVGYYDLGSGVELFDKYRANELKDAQQQSLADARNSQIETREAGLIEKGRKAIQGVLAQAGAYDAEGNLTSDALAVLERMARQSGATLEDLIGEEMTGAQARLYGGAGINPYQQAQLPLQERRVATGERNAATAEGRLAVSQQQASTAARALGLREGSAEWDKYMDLFDIANDTQKQQDSRNKGPKGTRQVPGSTGQRRLQIRPVGQ